MRILFCVPGSPGFVFPSVGIGKELSSLGYTCAFITSDSYKAFFDLHSLDLISYPSNDSYNFDIKSWFHIPSICKQYSEITKAVSIFMPDVLISFQHVISPYLINELYEIPLIIIGLATTIWPKDIDYLNRLPTYYSIQKQQSDLLSWIDIYNKFRATLNISPFTADRWIELYGDLFLLRSIPRLEPLDSNSVPMVRHIGPCIWEPRDSVSFLDACKYDPSNSKELIYIQHGRYFGGSEFLTTVLELLSKSYFSLVDIGRYDGTSLKVPPGDIVIGKSIPLSVMKYCSFVISTGSSTPVLSALKEGKPLILFPNGSRTEDIATQCEQHGLGFILDSSNFTEISINSCIDKIKSDEDLHKRLKIVKEEISVYNGLSRAIQEITNFTDFSVL